MVRIASRQAIQLGIAALSGLACSSPASSSPPRPAGKQPTPQKAAACPEGETKLCGLLAAHNVARATAKPRPRPVLPRLTWSKRLAKIARKWAEQCKFKHNQDRKGSGENLFAVWGAAATPKQVVQSWVGEVKAYDYDKNRCRKTCGHYTQVVWRATSQVGCAVKSCPDGMELWVCNYSPAGNYVGQRPY